MLFQDLNSSSICFFTLIPPQNSLCLTVSTPSSHLVLAVIPSPLSFNITSNEKPGKRRILKNTQECWKQLTMILHMVDTNEQNYIKISKMYMLHKHISNLKKCSYMATILCWYNQVARHTPTHTIINWQHSPDKIPKRNANNKVYLQAYRISTVESIRY